MKLGRLKSAAHNVADSLSSGLCFVIGHYALDIYAELADEPGGTVTVDFLNGTYSGKSNHVRRAVAIFREALPEFCAKHQVDVGQVAKLEARYAVDRVYGPNFTVTVAKADGLASTETYFGFPGRRPRRLRR